MWPYCYTVTKANRHKCYMNERSYYYKMVEFISFIHSFEIKVKDLHRFGPQ